MGKYYLFAGFGIPFILFLEYCKIYDVPADYAIFLEPV